MVIISDVTFSTYATFPLPTRFCNSHLSSLQSAAANDTARANGDLKPILSMRRLVKLLSAYVDERFAKQSQVAIVKSRSHHCFDILFYCLNATARE